MATVISTGRAARAYTYMAAHSTNKDQQHHSTCVYLCTQPLSVVRMLDIDAAAAASRLPRASQWTAGPACLAGPAEFRFFTLGPDRRCQRLRFCDQRLEIKCASSCSSARVGS